MSQPGVRLGRTSALLAVAALVILGIYFSIMLGLISPRLIPNSLAVPLFILLPLTPLILSIAAVVNAVRSRRAQGEFTGFAVLGLLLTVGVWIIALTLFTLAALFGRNPGGGP